MNTSTILHSIHVIFDHDGPVHTIPHGIAGEDGTLSFWYEDRTVFRYTVSETREVDGRTVYVLDRFLSKVEPPS